MEKNKENINLSEDELIIDLLNNDVVLEDEVAFKLIQQNENLLSYSIRNLFKDENKEKYSNLRKKDSILPELVLIDSNGNEATFVLTKEFVAKLKEDLTHVENAYSGYFYRPNIKKTLKERLTNIPNDIKEHPFQYLFLLGLIISFIGFSLI